MELVVFDVDGVIVDVSRSYHTAIVKTVEHFTKRRLSKEEALAFKERNLLNNDWDVSYKLIEEIKGKAPPYQEVVEVFNDYYKKYRELEIVILDRNFFSLLKDYGKVLAIVTGRPREDLDFLLNRAKLRGLFSQIVCEDDLPSPKLRKPSPYLLILCLEKLKFKGKEFIYVGDTRMDELMVENFNRVCKDVRAEFIKFTPKDEPERLLFLINKKFYRLP